MKQKYWIVTIIAAVGFLAVGGLALHDPSWRYHELVDASWKGDSSRVSELLEGGADPNGLKDSNLNPTREFVYPINGAAWNNHPEVIDLLVRSGADVNVTDSHGGSPLGTAARQGSIEAAKALLSHGAQPQIEPGRSTAEIARRFGHNEIAIMVEEAVIQAHRKHEE